MEMESSRRMFDRSREPGLKKPRLSDESERNQGMNRPFASAQRPVSNNPMVSRLRESDSGAGASGRGGGGYQPQPIPAVAQQQHQELVSQYRAALAELTFNSKPIITNLTIIAGENVNAAKAIASTICANIIEVPGDMKLPSLYLLDSIVKNIGRDYIKHFTVKLPEVFCKAYRQVEPPIHQSMRHLFGTWKGVFPLHTLQMIEKELGFISTTNGTPAVSTTVRPDSQANRPSIHVNPKYLERRLQQPTQAKGLSSDVSGSIANSVGDEESLDRATSISTSRSWVDPAAKMHNMQQRPQRSRETIQEKNISSEYADYDYSSDFLRNSGLGIDRPGPRIVEQGHEKPWYADGRNLPESLPGQRNNFNAKHGFPNYSAPESVNSISHLQSANNIVSRRCGISSDSWKNSDEEEFRWGDMSSRLAVHGAPDISSNFRKERSTSVDSERSGLEDHIHRPQSTHDFPSRILKEVSVEPKDFSAIPHRVSSPWLSRDSQPVDELSHPGNSSFGYTGNGVLGPARAPPHQRLQSLKSELPSLRQHPPLLTEQDRLRTQSPSHSDHKLSQFPGKSNMGIHDPYSHDTLPILPSHARLEKVVKSQAYEALPSSSIPGIQQKYQYAIPQQVEEPIESEPLNQTPKLGNCAPDRLNANPASSIEDPSPSSLLAAVLKSGVLPSLNLQNSGQFPSQKGRSPVPSGPTSLDPRSKVAPSSSTGHSPNASKSASVKISKKKVETSSLQSSSSPLDSAPEKTSKDLKSSPDPISNLLSSLVAKGLISASKTESPTQIPNKAVVSSVEKKKKSSSVAKTSSVSPFLASSSAVLSKREDKPSVSDPSPKRPVSLPEPVKAEIKSLIGFDFKTDVIRVFHQNVVDDLLEGYEHCCTGCGLRMKLQEQLNRHLELHDMEKTESRKWYTNITDRVGAGSEEKYLESEDEPDKDEPMAIADENNCVCVLCGEIFEDFYCQETDEWMFRGAKHLMVPSEGDQESLLEGPIIHAKCITESSLQDLGLPTRIKMEADA